MLNEVKAWIEQGKRDFRSAKNSFKSEDYYVSALLCQQAVEKWLKAILIRNGEELLKIHDLVKLSRKVNAPEEVISMCAEVDPVYFQVRYPESDVIPASKVNKKEAQHLLQLTKEILKWVRKVI